ncbi:MAG: sigma 54-interacting transcriptional regulator [Polyangiaceae bacterium]
MTEFSTRARRPPSLVRYDVARLSVTRGVDVGRSIEVADAPVTIGTGSGNDLMLTDDTVSRQHCEVSVEPGGIRIRDLGSTNGVFVGTMRVRDASMPEPVRFRVGSTELSVSASGAKLEREQVDADGFGFLVGSSPKMRQLYAVLERVAVSDISLLVEGETGTGKDVVAESIHRESSRRDEPFVVFDCGAVARELVESELFGHERGAFTGAHAARAGVFEQAQGGTLFLDEIGELPKDLQPKLLRALEKHEVRRVGGNRVIPVDVRVIAATNRHLQAEVANGAFRQDLFFRLAGAHVRVPPLRERLDDIRPLVALFLVQDLPQLALDDVPDSVWEMFSSHRWPGNVRELRNAVHRLAISIENPVLLSPEMMPGPGAAQTFLLSDGRMKSLQAARREANDAFEIAYCQAALRQGGGSVTQAALVAEVSRQLLQRLLKRHGIRER